jgi:hypothetical protein
MKSMVRSYDSPEQKAAIWKRCVHKLKAVYSANNELIGIENNTTWFLMESLAQMILVCILVLCALENLFHE